MEPLKSSVRRFSASDALTVELARQRLGRMSILAMVESLTVKNIGDESTSARLEAVSAREGDVSCAACNPNIAELKPLILSVGAGKILRESDFPGFRLDETITLSEAARILEDVEVAVVVFGPAVKPGEIRNLLESRGKEAMRRSVHVVLYEQTPPSAFQELINEDVIFYLAHASIAAHELCAMIVAAVLHYVRKESPPAPIVLTSLVNPPLFTGSVYWVVLQERAYQKPWRSLERRSARRELDLQCLTCDL